MASLETPAVPPAESQSLRRGAFRRNLLRFAAVLGPGLVVMFADTEAGSITTAATSGAQFGYKLILLQLLLIVPLFVVQEMTVRLGTVTGKGHARLIREFYGLGWAWVSLGTMLITNIAALVTEFAGIAGAAQIFGLPSQPMVILAAALLAIVIFTASYKRAEAFALALCAIELCFIPAAFAAHPSLHALVTKGIFGHQPLNDQAYLLLIASNIGAVIMPWMIFYQQSAVVDKGLTERDIGFARLDTAIGSVLTQAIMCAVVITTAATLFVHRIPVSDAAHAAMALQPLVGQFAGVTFGAGLIGASMLGAFVVSLATAWAFGEAFGWRCSLNDGLRAKRFVALYLACVFVAAAIVLIPGLPLILMTTLRRGVQRIRPADRARLPPRARQRPARHRRPAQRRRRKHHLLLALRRHRRAGPMDARQYAPASRGRLVIKPHGALALILLVAGCAHRTAAPDFTLLDDRGRPWTLSAQRGHPVVLDFGFTHCADTCPLTLAKLVRTVDGLGGSAGGTTIAFVTVDPQRDTPAAMHAFISRFGASGRLVGLTGSPEQIARVERAYYVWAQRVPGSPRTGSYDVAHSTGIYFIDAAGARRAIRDDGDSQAALTTALREIL